MLNCENVAIDRVIETLGVRNEEENDIQTTIIRYTPFYRLYLLTQVVTNLLHRSCSLGLLHIECIYLVLLHGVKRMVNHLQL